MIITCVSNVHFYISEISIQPNLNSKLIPPHIRAIVNDGQQGSSQDSTTNPDAQGTTATGGTA